MVPTIHKQFWYVFMIETFEGILLHAFMYLRLLTNMYRPLISYLGQ